MGKIEENLQSQKTINVVEEVTFFSNNIIINLDEENEECLNINTEKTILIHIVENFRTCYLENVHRNKNYVYSSDDCAESDLKLISILEDLLILKNENFAHFVEIFIEIIFDILALLMHRNMEVAFSTIEFFHRFIDRNIVNIIENYTYEEYLVESIISSLIQNLERLYLESEDDKIFIIKSLSIIERILDAKEVYYEPVVKQLFLWILDTFRHSDSIGLTQICTSKLLYLLLDNKIENCQIFEEIDGIEVIVDMLSYFQTEPFLLEAEEDQVILDYICEALNFLLVEKSALFKFINANGMKLLVELLSKTLSTDAHVLLLGYLLSGPHGVTLCSSFVSCGGLSLLFSKIQKVPEGRITETLVLIVASLLKNCIGFHWQRVVNKFTENNFFFTKIIIKMHFVYLLKMQEFDEINLNEDNVINQKKIDEGLFTLQLVDYIVVLLSFHKKLGIKSEVLRLLNYEESSTSDIKLTVTNYSKYFTDKGEQDRLLDMIEKF